MSCGRYTDNPSGPGFQFFFSKREKHFVLQLATQTKRWEIILEYLPRDTWFHVSITWDRQHGLKFYRNGDLIVTNTKPNSVKYTPLRSREGTFTLGRPNSMFKLDSYGNFSIGHLVIWTHELTHYEVRVAYESVIYRTKKSSLCCHSRAGVNASKVSVRHKLCRTKYNLAGLKNVIISQSHNHAHCIQAVCLAGYTSCKHGGLYG